MVLVSQLVDRLDVIGVLDESIGPVKQRDRGLSAGEFVVAMTESLIAGGDFLCDLDYARDGIGASLRSVDPPPSTTANSLARRFGDDQIAGIETAVGEIVRRAFARMDRPTRRRLRDERPTIDVDATEIEVYGPKKQGVAYNYLGQLAGRSLPATWANLGVTLAADLFAGNIDPRSHAAALIGRAIEALPAGLRRPIVRLDSGFFAYDIIDSCLAAGADWAVAAPRNKAVWTAIRAANTGSWRPAKHMRGTEVAEIDYQPRGWPPGRAICRRVRLRPDQIPANPRARRRRTIDPEQLVLFANDTTITLYSYSVILTNLTGRADHIEAWFRDRAQIEDRIRDTKLGYALRHLPSGDERVNQVWAWATHLALDLTVILQTLTAPHAQRAHAKRLRRELIAIPGRITYHARTLTLRLPATHDYIEHALERLQHLKPAA